MQEVLFEKIVCKSAESKRSFIMTASPSDKLIWPTVFEIMFLFRKYNLQLLDKIHSEMLQKYF